MWYEDSELNIQFVSIYEFCACMFNILGSRKLNELLLETGMWTTVNAPEYADYILIYFIIYIII